ncbi:hypothetical protein GCM10016272_16000 [Psychrobacter glaciei]|uniref:Uncharacterized protein n=1 Tax=Psychrobacter glaciei TaxID=619771 RepID=A0ABQ3GRN3_9GAMM|nr:hypothetical protein GCM10016272_16000 [Psychrobacter glaciei]
MTVIIELAISFKLFSEPLMIILRPISAAKLSEIMMQNCTDPMTADNKIMTILDVQKLFGRR